MRMEVDLVKVQKEREDKEENKRNGCRLGEVDHCGYTEQLQPTNISIKPAVLSQSLTNGTLGRTEIGGGEKKRQNCYMFHLGSFSLSIGINVITYLSNRDFKYQFVYLKSSQYYGLCTI